MATRPLRCRVVPREVGYHPGMIISILPGEAGSPNEHRGNFVCPTLPPWAWDKFGKSRLIDNSGKRSYDPEAGKMELPIKLEGLLEPEFPPPNRLLGKGGG